MLEAYMQPGPIYITAAIMLILAVVFFFFFVKVNRKSKAKYDAAMAKYNKAIEDFEKSKAAKESAKAEDVAKNAIKSYERCVLFMSTTGSCFDIPMNDTLTVGKNPKCNFHIENDSVADMHCKILYKAGKYYLQDMGSNSGTAYDGDKIAPESTIEIRNGLIQFGRVSFMMTLE